MARCLRLLVLLAVLPLAQACRSTTDRAPETIGLAEATEVLRRAEAFATAGDAVGLCSLTDNQVNCQFLLEQAGGIANAPGRSPTVVDSFIVPSRGTSLGGRVLVLAGTTARGEPFRTDFLVFDRGNNQLTPLAPVYWSGVGLGDRSRYLVSAPSAAYAPRCFPRPTMEYQQIHRLVLLSPGVPCARRHVPDEADRAPDRRRIGSAYGLCYHAVVPVATPVWKQEPHSSCCRPSSS